MDRSLRDELREEVDEVWAETIRHLPLKDGAPDAERQPFEFSAPLRTGERDVERVSYGRGNQARAGMTASGGELRIDREIHHTLEIREGDKVVALERPGEPVFEVKWVDDRHHLRFICELGDSN